MNLFNKNKLNNNNNNNYQHQYQQQLILPKINNIYSNNIITNTNNNINNNNNNNSNSNNNNNTKDMNIPLVQNRNSIKKIDFSPVRKLSIYKNDNQDNDENNNTNNIVYVNHKIRFSSDFFRKSMESKMFNDVQNIEPLFSNNSSLLKTYKENQYLWYIERIKPEIKSNYGVYVKKDNKNYKLNNAANCNNNQDSTNNNYQVKSNNNLNYKFSNTNNKKEIYTIYKYHFYKEMKSGNCFGELALESERGIRNLTVISSENTHFGFIKKSNYVHLVLELKKRASKLTMEFLYKVPLFSKIPPIIIEKKILNNLYFTKVAYNEEIFGSDKCIINKDKIAILKRGVYNIKINKSLFDIIEIINTLGPSDSFKLFYKENEKQLNLSLPNFKNTLKNKKMNLKVGIVKDIDVIGLSDSYNPFSNDYYFKYICNDTNGEIYIMDKKQYMDIVENDKMIRNSFNQYIKNKINIRKYKLENLVIQQLSILKDKESYKVIGSTNKNNTKFSSCNYNNNDSNCIQYINSKGYSSICSKSLTNNKFFDDNAKYRDSNIENVLENQFSLKEKLNFNNLISKNIIDTNQDEIFKYKESIYKLDYIKDAKTNKRYKIIECENQINNEFIYNSRVIIKKKKKYNSYDKIKKSSKNLCNRNVKGKSASNKKIKLIDNKKNDTLENNINSISNNSLSNSSDEECMLLNNKTNTKKDKEKNTKSKKHIFKFLIGVSSILKKDNTKQNKNILLKFKKSKNLNENNNKNKSSSLDKKLTSKSNKNIKQKLLRYNNINIKSSKSINNLINDNNQNKTFKKKFPRNSSLLGLIKTANTDIISHFANYFKKNYKRRTYNYEDIDHKDIACLINKTEFELNKLFNKTVKKDPLKDLTINKDFINQIISNKLSPIILNKNDKPYVNINTLVDIDYGYLKKFNLAVNNKDELIELMDTYIEKHKNSNNILKHLENKSITNNYNNNSEEIKTCYTNKCNKVINSHKIDLHKKTKLPNTEGITKYNINSIFNKNKNNKNELSEQIIKRNIELKNNTYINNNQLSYNTIRNDALKYIDTCDFKLENNSNIQNNNIISNSSLKNNIGNSNDKSSLYLSSTNNKVNINCKNKTNDSLYKGSYIKNINKFNFNSISKINFLALDKSINVLPNISLLKNSKSNINIKKQSLIRNFDNLKILKKNSLKESSKLIFNIQRKNINSINYNRFYDKLDVKINNNKLRKEYFDIKKKHEDIINNKYIYNVEKTDKNKNLHLFNNTKFKD